MLIDKIDETDFQWTPPNIIIQVLAAATFQANVSLKKHSERQQKEAQDTLDALAQQVELFRNTMVVKVKWLSKL